MVGLSCAVLIGIFLFQRLGTARIGFSYAPILLLWFTCNAAIGCYNIATCYPAIFRVSQRLCAECKASTANHPVRPTGGTTADSSIIIARSFLLGE